MRHAGGYLVVLRVLGVIHKEVTKYTDGDSLRLAETVHLILEHRQELEQGQGFSALELVQRTMEVLGLVLEFLQILKIILRWFQCHIIEAVIAVVHHRLEGLENG